MADCTNTQDGKPKHTTDIHILGGLNEHIDEERDNGAVGTRMKIWTQGERERSQDV